MHIMGQFVLFLLSLKNDIYILGVLIEILMFGKLMMTIIYWC